MVTQKISVAIKPKGKKMANVIKKHIKTIICAGLIGIVLGTQIAPVMKMLPEVQINIQFDQGEKSNKKNKSQLRPF